MISLICLILIFYSLYKPNPFSKSKDPNPVKLKKTLLTLSTYAILFLFILSEFNEPIYENYYTLMSFVFSIFLLIIAYRYDNQSILSLGLMVFTLSIALLISPKDALDPFANTTDLNIAAIILSILFLLASFLSIRYGFKEHFIETFNSFALNIIGLIAFFALIEGSFNEKIIYSSILFLSLTYFSYIAFKNQILSLKINLFCIIVIFLIFALNQDKMSLILEMQRAKFEQLKQNR